jgi:hypothetical protein
LICQPASIPPVQKEHVQISVYRLEVGQN